MGYPVKIQQITRKDFNQYYINFPRPIALAMNFSKGDIIEWEITDKDTLILKRKGVDIAEIPLYKIQRKYSTLPTMAIKRSTL